MVNHIYLILQGKIYLRVVVYLLFFQHQKRWTKMIMSVKHIDDYKKIMNYLLFLETHRYPGTDHTSLLQEDPEADTCVIQKFNRDLVYYNKIQKLIKK